MIENIVPILRVADLEASRQHYQEILGFEADWSLEDFACVARDGARIYLTTGEQGQGSTWLWVGVEDVEACHAACAAAGARITMGLRNYPWAREFRVTDPDGHVLRFGGEPEAGQG